VRDLLSTYGFRGGVEPMVGLAVQLRELGAEGRLCALPVPQPTDLIVLSLIVLGRRLRTACLGAVRPTSCDRQLWRRFTEHQSPPRACASE
jgi:vancomycin aglycone glucosyltransferase